MRDEILREYHDGHLGGHLSWKKVHERIRERYWWPKMIKDIKAYVASCIECQERNEGHRNKYGLLQPIPVDDAPWKSVTIDFSGEMPETERGNKHILVMVCNTTKSVELRATKAPSAEAAAQGLVEDVVYRHGCPKKIGSDRGSHFTSDVIAGLARMLDAKQHFSVAYHPQSHGQVEIALKNVQKLLSHMVSQHQRDWDTKLPRVAAIMRFAPNETTGESPFYLTYGRDPRMPVDTALPVLEDYEQDRRTSVSDQAKEVAKGMREVFERVKEHTEKRQEQMKKQYDKNRMPAPPELDVGHKVMLKVTRLDFPGTSRKLAKMWRGPYIVAEKTSELNRVVKNCANPGDVQVVHVERLRPFIERKVGDDGGDVMEEERPEDAHEVDEILQERAGKDGGREFLVKWKGFTARHNEWVAAEELNADELLARFDLRPEEARRQPLPTTRRRTGTTAGPKPKIEKPKVEKEKARSEGKARDTDEREGKEGPHRTTRSGRLPRARVRLDL